MKTLVLFLTFLVCLTLSMPVNAQGLDLKNLTQTEAQYILQCQFMNVTNPAYGCLNNVFGLPTWVVPRENAMAILGLIMAKDILGDDSYLQRAQLAADYLTRVQDTDGAWYNQYNFTTPGDPAHPENSEAWAKSPTQTAEVMIAFYKLGYDQGRYASMKKGADYLMACQQNGGNDYLIGGGKDKQGNFRNRRWASDNAYAYQALKAAEIWSLVNNDYNFTRSCNIASRKIIAGINTVLYIKNSTDPDYGVWYRVVDENNQPIEPWHHDWINYAPQMLDVPAYGVNSPRVGNWIHNTLQEEDGACVWDNNGFRFRKSPGYSFQATLCWRDLKQTAHYEPALNWAADSGLWQTTPDTNHVTGGWIDWIDEQNNEQALWWERFIDTSFYAIAAYNGGYNFRIMSPNVKILYEIREEPAGNP